MGNEFNIGIGLFDLLFIIFIGYFIFTSKNFIYSLFDLISFLITIVLAYKNYAYIGRFLTESFGLTKGVSSAVGFFIAWFVTETLLFFISRYLITKIPKDYLEHSLNRFFAATPAFIEACLFYLLIVTTIFSLPVKANIKEEILHSRSGPIFISLSHILENRIKSVFGEAVNETLNFITIREGSTTEVDLGFKVNRDALTSDPESERVMINLVNKERLSQGGSELVEDLELRQVAREYAITMFENGFFSHVSPVDGSTPSERVERAGISFFVTGENLAYAPDVYVAHQGLMNSPGHRRNILAPDFGKVGIGIIDGGIYGKMFVQVFKD